MVIVLFVRIVDNLATLLLNASNSMAIPLAISHLLLVIKDSLMVLLNVLSLLVVNKIIPRTLKYLLRLLLR